MDNEQAKQHGIGVMYTTLAYLIWGILPLYWKLLDEVTAFEILAHRVFWSFVFVMMIIFVSKRLQTFSTDLKNTFTNVRALFAVSSAAVLISTNWFIYIWAVNADHIIEASLGYYINPLVSVLLGIIVLKERLLFWQSISFILAGVGVLILTFQYGQFPWIAITLAVSFGLYGLTKKLTKLDPIIGLTLETLLVAPIAFLYLAFLANNQMGSFLPASFDVKLLLIGAGIVTAMPLLWFAQGAKRIPLSMIGILQYIAPTISLVLGVFLYNEHFSKVHLVTFMFIWTALVIYSFSKTKLFIALQPKTRKKTSIGA
ncbi:EamA family transporter RarD [Bacillus timonensis]|nr:EamA family transporter RarD [Bacillus timonensis]